ncbi:MAG: hypothetical protein HDR88_01680 [Bacteroides sp.]|nr:hypothetical protein [Bacteroides sp.]
MAASPTCVPPVLSDSQYVTTEVGQLSEDAQKAWQIAHPRIEIPKARITIPKSPQVVEEADEVYYTVTPVIPTYPEYLPSMYIFAFSVDDPSFYSTAYNFGEDMVFPFNLKGGLYDFLFYFQGADGIRFIVKENIEVSGDMEVTAEPTEATNHIAFRPLFSTGERISTDIWKMNSSEEFILVKEGNTSDAEQYTQFVYNDVNIMCFEIGLGDSINEEGDVVTGSVWGDAWVTPSEKLSVYQKVIANEKNEGISMIVIGANGTKTQEVSNNIKYYTEPVEANYVESLYKPEIEENPFGIDPYSGGCMGYYTNINGVMQRANFSFQNPCSWETNKYRSCLDPVYTLEVDLMPQFTDIQFWDFPNGHYGIVAPLYSFTENKWVAIHPIYGITYDSILETSGALPDGSLSMIPNQALSFTSNESIIFGNNTPITTFLKPSNYFCYSFVGRYGEIRTIDLLNHNLRITLNGEEVCNAYDDLNMFFNSDLALENGEWRYYIENSNMKVGGLQGKNSCEMYFPQGSSGISPTIMQLQMRNSEGKVTDQFDNKEDAIITFAAGGFKEIFNPDTFISWFDYEPLEEVTLEYAPYGSENYLFLEVVEDPEKFFMPGYGAYYYSPLSRIDCQSETGWYDVRISLKDVQGDTQVQTISPAFRIDSSTSVNSVVAKNNTVRVEGNDIVAPEDAIVFNTSGQRSGTHNLVPGVYIVHTTAGVTKCVIK